MPKEVILKCETQGRLDELSVQWGGADRSVVLAAFHVDLRPIEGLEAKPPQALIAGAKITELFGVDISGIDPELARKLTEAVLAQNAIMTTRADPRSGHPPAHGEEAAEDPVHGEWFADALWGLDRAAINKLIRVLRHARDKSYGRDE